MLNLQERHYLLGYGSLISAESRAKTGETGQVWPVKLHGFERHWSTISDEFGMSSVVVIKATEKACNGVLIEVPVDAFPAFDERERGYQRVEIDPQQLTSYKNEALPKGVYWVYHAQEVVPPNEQNPIALSYVDVILSGCIEYGRAFTNDFLALTQGWSSPLLNDRPMPRYPRVQPDLATDELNALLRPIVDLSEEELAIAYEL